MGPPGQATLTTTAVSVAVQMAQSGPSGTMVDTSAAEWVGEGWTAGDVSVMHAVGIVQSDAILPPRTGTEEPEVRQAEGDASVATPGVMATGPRSVSMSSTSTTVGEAIPKERPWHVGSPIRGAGAEPPQTPIRMGTNMPRLMWADQQNPRAPPFILDDPAEEKEWHDYCGIMKGVAHLLHTALVSANNGLKQFATDPYLVQRARAPDCHFLFHHF